MTVQCEATSKRSGERCRRHAVVGHRVCRMHGGTVRRGTNSPRWKHGRFSRHLPAFVKRLANQLVREEPDLRSDVALLHALILTVTDRARQAGRELNGREIDAIVTLIDARRKVVEAYWRREERLADIVPGAQFRDFCVSVAEILRRNVQEPLALRSIQSELKALLRGSRPDINGNLASGGGDGDGDNVQ